MKGLKGARWRHGQLGSIAFGAGLALATPCFAQSADESAYIPLNPGEHDTATVSVEVGGGPATEVLFDTGSNGLRILSSAVGPDVQKTDTMITYGYGSDLVITGVLATAYVTFNEATTPDGSPLTTTAPIAFQYVTETSCKAGSGKTDCQMPEGTSGVMGVGYQNRVSEDQDTAFNPLAQLPGNFASGFIVEGWNTLDTSDPNARVVVGLTPENTAGFVFMDLEADPNSTPPEGANAWSTTVQTCFSVNGAQPPICGPTLLDTGATNGKINGDLDPSVLDSNGQIKKGNSVAVTVGTLPTLVITTDGEGATYSEGDQTRNNTGQLIYEYYTIAFDAKTGRLGFAPMKSLIYGVYEPENDASFGPDGISVGLDAKLILNDGFTSSRAFLIGGDAEIDVKADATATLSGTLSGANGLAVTGHGTLVLDGLNTYTGGTQVTGGGTLRVTGDGALGGAGESVELDDGTLSTIDGFYSPNRTLVVGGSGGALKTDGLATWGGAISGDGTLHFQEGAWNLTGSGATTGGAHVDSGGLLAANGDFSEWEILVHQGGVLMGTGTVGKTEVEGTLSPGNSIGTLKVNGALELASGSALDIELGANGRGDLVDAAGAIIIDGATLHLSRSGNAVLGLGDSSIILTSASGISGSGFADVGDPFGALYPFLDADVSIGATDVQVDVVRSDVPFAALGANANQRSVAGALDRLPLSNRLVEEAASLTAAQAPGAFTALSGGIYPSASTVLMDQSAMTRGIILERAGVPDLAPVAVAPVGPLGYADGDAASSAFKAMPPVKAVPAMAEERSAFWAEAFGDSGSISSTANTAGVDTSSGGLLVGYDHTWASGWRFGFAAGYSHDSFSADDLASSGSSENYHLAAYGGMKSGPWGLRFGGLYTWNDLSVDRQVVFGSLVNQLSADYSARTGQLFAEVGYGANFGGVGIEPFAGLAYVNLDTDGFQEVGGPAALTGLSDSVGVTYSTLGARLTVPLPVGVPAALRAKIAWQHAFGDTDPVALLAFGVGTVPFAETGAPIAEDAALIDAGLEVSPLEQMSLKVSYSGQLAENTSINAVKGSFTLRF